MQNTLKLIEDFLSFHDWNWIHVGVETSSGKNEIYLTNPVLLLEPGVTPEPEATPVPVKPETLAEKINRFRTAPFGSLPEVEELWWKERQKELEDRKIGQIVPEDTPEQALEKLKIIGVE